MLVLYRLWDLLPNSGESNGKNLESQMETERLITIF